MNNSPLLSKKSVGSFLGKNSVTLLFLFLAVGAFFVSNATLTFLLPELFTRISRNAFLVLSLLIPVVAGIGLNFGIVIGAIAAQIAMFLVVYFGFSGFGGFMLCVVIATPLAILFGFLVGKLFNKMKGSEMIGGIVLRYFTDGLYQLLFLNIIGGVLPFTGALILNGVGVKNVIDLAGTLKYSLDNMPMLNIADFAVIAVVAVLLVQLVYRLVKKQDLQIKKWAITLVVTVGLYALTFIPTVTRFMSTDRLQLLSAIEIGAVLAVVYNVFYIVRDKKLSMKRVAFLLVTGVIYGLTYVPALEVALKAVYLPVLTYILILGLYMLIPWFLNTKLGQEMRTVGQNRHVAASAGINVDRVRIIAMIISTVLAAYGQLISLQNIGTITTYGAHLQVGEYAIAALLVGGASVNHATTKNAMLGIVLFHTLFILAPEAGSQLLGNAQIGEYFRVFIGYGVIALALALHAWRTYRASKQPKDAAAARAAR